MKKNYKKIVIPVIAVGAVGAVAIGSRFLLKGNEKDIKVGEITSNAIDSMNSAICSAINSLREYERGSGDGSNVAVNNGSLDMSVGQWLSKEEFSAATGLTGDKLDEYFGYYMAGKDGGDNPEDALNVLMQIAIENEDIVTPSSSDNSGNSSAEVADNSKPGSTGNNNSGGNGNSGNSNGGSSSSSNVENDSQNQNDNVYIPSDEDRAAMEAMQDNFITGGGQSDSLTDEQREAEEAAMEGLQGY
ncbi:hypothetical protein [Roseburia sp. 499]|uniref:hypothetical protein n=1 Tax=Roseburia sp. 499 TaxID=1261634 RepID=UPI00095301E8|nr:hypothetical protein [Roseburia sp. 499]WVK69383.1 hypothetical protein BIV20_13610 [Roseburia sp. 499]